MKGIMFNEDLHRLVVWGEKTETRRLHSLRKLPAGVGLVPTDPEMPDTIRPDKSGCVYDRNGNRYKPKYKKGETVYMKEPYASSPLAERVGTVYKYDLKDGAAELFGFKNKMFMPERHARHYIRITDVYAQRVLSITEGEARREACGVGIYFGANGHNAGAFLSHRGGFLRRFAEINKAYPGKHTYVWAYVFERK